MKFVILFALLIMIGVALTVAAPAPLLDPSAIGGSGDEDDGKQAAPKGKKKPPPKGKKKGLLGLGLLGMR